MIVCHCNAVTDHEIKRLVREGCKTVNDVVQCCGASASCGGCKELVERIVSAELNKIDDSN